MKTTDIHPSSFSNEYILFDSEITSGKMKDMVVEILNDLCDVLKTRGCRLIGHIKALLYTASEENLFFSVTSFNASVHCKGNISSIARDAKLIVNVIVYGIKNEELKTICNDVMEKANMIRIIHENGVNKKW